LFILLMRRRGASRSTCISEHDCSKIETRSGLTMKNGI
jgi:hypothetical protein